MNTMTNNEIANLIATYIQSIVYAPSAVADNEVTKHLDFTLETAMEVGDILSPLDLLHEATNMFDLDEIIEATMQSTTKINGKFYIVDGAIPSKELEDAVLRKLK